jgi:hypothetical protein
MADVNAAEEQQYYRSALEDQRHLLRISTEATSAGDLTQALHVATSIRVLIHETSSSVPLLKRLNSNFWELPIPELIQEASPTGPTGVQPVLFYCDVSRRLKPPDGIVSLVTNFLLFFTQVQNCVHGGEKSRA